MKFFSFFTFVLLFFLLNLVRSSFPKLQNIEINFFCKVVELQTQFCLPKYFGATPLGTLPKLGPKTEFFENEQYENRSN